MNSDGFDDIIVGAPGADTGKGYAKLYLGGLPFDTLADLIFVLDENEKGGGFGHAIACKGDLNGDGFSDLVISAPYYGFFQEGRIFVFFGKEPMDTIPDVVIPASSSYYYYHLGYSISIEGDVNGDGFDDLVASAPIDDYDARGRVYIYYGGTAMDSIADVYLEGEEAFDMFGESVDIIGDVNKDGFDDFLVGAPQILANNKPGKVYLFYGDENISFPNSEIFGGDTTKYFSGYGIKISGLEDVNGDGFTDFGILADKYFRIISGRYKNIFLQVSKGVNWYGSFQSISNGGDINNDGFKDILISKQESNSNYAGEVEIYLGGASLDTVPDYTIFGKTAHYCFGSSIDYVGDINKDGEKEIIIGEKQKTGPSGPTGYGKAYIYSFGPLNRIAEKELSYLPKRYNLTNYPNPFNSCTKISYYLPIKNKIQLIVYNSTGQELAVLTDKEYIMGTYTINWDASKYPSGIYFCCLVSENRLITSKKIILIK
jgi:hypothetical protein